MTPPCGHPYASPPVAGCVVCSIRDVPFHKQRWTTGVIATVAHPARPLCIHLGTRINIVGQQREHFECTAGHGTVCPCRECQTCSDYVPRADDD